ncbi:MAG: hypothetical protein LBQ24_07415 [Candidatus Peribacteria bacterium]|nr:hypothetical protein [Candidatus Peribacteria bacterium]
MLCLQETTAKYHIIHIIAALTTGAPNQTKIVNNKIMVDIKINLIKGGKYFAINPKNIIKIVMLKPETAIK